MAREESETPIQREIEVYVSSLKSKAPLMIAYLLHLPALGFLIGGWELAKPLLYVAAVVFLPGTLIGHFLVRSGGCRRRVHAE